MPLDEAQTRTVIDQLLTKLKVADPAALPLDRATKKLKNRLGQPGATLPEAPTAEEAEVLAGLGITVKAAADAVPPDSDTGSEKRLYTLPACDGKEARTELITPAKAEYRNSQRKDGLKWTPAKEGELPKASKKAAPPAKGKAGPKDGTTAAAKEPKAPKAPAAPKDPNAKPRVNGSQIFRDILEGGKRMKKADVLEKLIAKEVKPETAASYLVWGKRDPANKIDNPFGFRIEEWKDDKGVKWVQEAKAKKAADKEAKAAAKA